MNGVLNESTVVKKFDFNKPDLHEIDYLLDEFFKDCRNKLFHSFKYRLVYDINFRNISNNEEINFTITHRTMELEIEFHGLNKRIKIARENGFIFNQINELTVKIYSTLSNVNADYDLKFQIPIIQRQFFEKMSQNKEYAKTHCYDLNNPFHFACRKWYLYNNPQ